MADRPSVSREIVEHPGSVVIVPVTEHGTVLLVRQWRHPAQDALLEVPAGTLNDGEEPAATAARELREETGHTADRLVGIGAFWVAPGWCTEYMYAYMATGLRPDPLPQDVDEDVKLEETALERVPELIKSGAIRDAKSIASLMMVLQLYPEELAATLER